MLGITLPLTDDPASILPPGNNRRNRHNGPHIKRNDNTARTYQIVEQTANAVRLNSRGGKTRIRRYLQLIDKSFWREPLPGKSGNRLTRAFLSWQENSKDLDIERRKIIGYGRRGEKHYSSPYLLFNQKKLDFSLAIPAQLVKFEDAPGLHWSVRINEQEQTHGINPYAAVTGFKTDEITIPIAADDVLSGIQIELKNAAGRLRQFRISASPIRFFDDEGYMLSENAIDEGNVVSFSRKDFIPVSDAIEDYVNLNSLRMTYYTFVRGDIVSLPDGKPISVGKRIQEGLLPRGSIDGVTAGEDRVTVFSSAPSVLVKALARRTAGMAISVNGKLWKVDGNEDKIQSFELMDRSGETGYILHLSDWGCQTDGLYTVTIDIPNDRSFRQWRFMLVNGMDFRFEDAPYVFKSVGTLCTPPELAFDKTDDIEKCDSDDIGNHWSFFINPDLDDVKLRYLGTDLFFAVPALSYCFQGEEWSCEYHNNVWHSEFRPVLYVRCPASRITFSLDDSSNDDEDEEHSLSFAKIQERNLFECDLNPFRSCFDRNIAKRRIYLSFPGLEKRVRFLEVYTRSIFVSGMLTENYKTGTIDGAFDIVGKANYYVDLHFKGEKLAEKIPIVDGKVSIRSKLRSGSYFAQIFEAEEDEFGFGDLVYYEIGKKTLELVNAMDLSGKCIRIVSLMKNDETQNSLQLKRDYIICGLESLDDMQGHMYSGIMIVRNRNGDGRGIFKAYLEIPELSELNKGYITFDDDGDPTEFLYDDEKNIIVRRPQEGLPRAARYRRYNKSVYPEDYVFEYEFMPAGYLSQNTPVCNDVKDYKYSAMTYSVSFRFKQDQTKHKAQPQTLRPAQGQGKMDENATPIGWIVYSDRPGNCTIETAGFSIRTYNSLHRAGYTELLPLGKMRCSELLKIRNLGRSGVMEVVEVLKRHGLPLPGDDIHLGVEE